MRWARHHGGTDANNSKCHIVQILRWVQIANTDLAVEGPCSRAIYIFPLLSPILKIRDGQRFDFKGLCYPTTGKGDYLIF